MLFEALNLICNLATAADSNDVQRQNNYANTEAEYIRAYDNSEQRKHETTMAVIGGVFSLMNAVVQASANNDNNGNNGGNVSGYLEG